MGTKLAVLCFKTFNWYKYLTLLQHRNNHHQSMMLIFLCIDYMGEKLPSRIPAFLHLFNVDLVTFS